MKSYLFPGLIFALLAKPIFAEPIDKNDSGLFIGGGAHFGQSFNPGGGGKVDASFAWGGDLGFVLRRDSWNRIEIGGELLNASHSFKDSSGTKVKLNFFPQALFKFGYGYSLGDHVFGIFRVGAGMGLGEYENNGFTADASAIIGMLGYDLVIPATDFLDIIFGLQIRNHNVSVDDINGNSIDSFQLNSTTIFGQLRIQI